MLDAYQSKISKNFNSSSWLNSQENCNKLFEWTTFYRRNMNVFVEQYLQIPLHWYQVVWIYLLNLFSSVAIIAGRASAKSFIIAIFSCAKCILYPKSRVVVASGTKKQAGLIVTEKIQKELMPRSENLRREIDKIKTNQNDIEVVFKNGSSIVVVPASENALGYRSTVLICEEFKLIKKLIVDSILKPFQIARPAEYRTRDCYSGIEELLEEPVNIYISSSWRTTHWMWPLIKQMIKGKFRDNSSCVLATDYSITLKHGIKTRKQLLDDKRTFDPITWRIEYENEMLRENVNAYFTYDMCNKNQVNKKAFYPQTLFNIRNKKKNPFSIPKQPNEIRLLSCDMAFVERADKNDNSAFSCIRLLPESVTYKSENIDGSEVEVKQGYRRIYSYIEANKGSDVDKQAIRIKQLYYDFDSDYLVLDTRNGGILVYDRLAKILYDEDRDCEYPAWKCMNDEDIANRVRVAGAIENTFAINATEKLNDIIALTMRDILINKRIDFLVNLSDIQDYLQEKIPEYSTGEVDTMMFYERPYLETQALINEMISLEFEIGEKSKAVRLSEVGANTKDRYVSCAYGNYYASLLEQDLLSDNSDYDYVIDYS